MKTADPMAAFKAADIAHEQAAQALIDATSAAFPPGTRIMATLGAHRLELAVLEASGCTWYKPALLCCQNVKTGKIRSFQATEKGLSIEILKHG